MTEKEAAETTAIILAQLAQIHEGNTWIDCGKCYSAYPLWKLYRCYYCGIWFCERCCPEHFGKKRELMAVRDGAL